MARPRLLGTFSFSHASGEDARVADVDVPYEGFAVCLVTCGISAYPLDRHIVHARHGGASEPYTFPHFTFHPEPPGIPVGPWPGWRSIPPMPRVEIRQGAHAYPASFHFWGDEKATQRIRVVGSFPFHRGPVEVRIGDERIVPLHCDIYEVPDVLAADRPAPAAPRHIPLPTPLFINDLPALRRKAAGSLGDVYEEIRRILGCSGLPFEVTPESKTLPGAERLGPQDEVMLSALVALIDGDTASVSRAADAFERYMTLTRSPSYEPLRIDTQCGEALFVLCLGFDWLRTSFRPDERERHRERIFEIADLCLWHMGSGRRDLLQAHYLGVATGLLAFALVFRREYHGAEELLLSLAGVAERMMSMLPEDGSYPHGINLWIYEHGFLLRFLEMMSLYTGKQYLRDHSYFANASRFRRAAMTDDGLHAVTFGDPQYRVSGDAWMHFLISSRSGNGAAYDLGLRLSPQSHEGVDFRNTPARRRVYEILFRGDPLPPADPVDRVVFFEDMGQVFVRTADAVLTTRSGAPLGERRYQSGAWGAYGHGDPSNGSFLFWRKGDFVVSGPGPVYRRECREHNIVTVNGKGQLGDGCVWLPDFFPPEGIPPPPSCEHAGDAVVMDMDLTAAYLPFLRVVKATRKLIVDLRSCIVGRDVVECADEADIEWNIHSRGQLAFEGDDGLLQWRIVLPHASYRLAVYTEPLSRIETGLSEFVPAYPNDGARDTFLRLTQHARTACIVWSLTWE